MIRVCRNCNNQFNGKLFRTVFCSNACHIEWRKANQIKEKSQNWKGGNVDVSCEFCKKIFSIRRDWVGIRKYCCKQCYTNSMKKRDVRQCLFCQKDFYPDKETSRYCSRSCSDKHKVKENHSCWQGGKSYEPYPPTFDKEFKSAIRERDNNTCAVCGNFGNNVHHINYVKMDTTPENCVTLCRSCHAKTNSNRDYWIKYFSSC